jgi:hypothetical protein
VTVADAGIGDGAIVDARAPSVIVHAVSLPPRFRGNQDDGVDVSARGCNSSKECDMMVVLRPTAPRGRRKSSEPNRGGPVNPSRRGRIRSHARIAAGKADGGGGGVGPDEESDEGDGEEAGGGRGPDECVPGWARCAVLECEEEEEVLIYT